MWVRGLKQVMLGHASLSTTVAPYVGAWIETKVNVYIHNDILVAPYVGAWIETFKAGPVCNIFESHPMWVRGLKLPWKEFTPTPAGRTLCGCVD